jgi:hypothetical protein
LRRIARLVLTQQLALGGIAFGDMDYLALHRIECPDIADRRGDDALQMENSRSRAVRSTCRNFVTISFALRQQRSLIPQQDCLILDKLPAGSGLRQGQWMIDFPNAMKYY